MWGSRNKRRLMDIKKVCNTMPSPGSWKHVSTRLSSNQKVERKISRVPESARWPETMGYWRLRRMRSDFGGNMRTRRHGLWEVMSYEIGKEKRFLKIILNSMSPRQLR